MELTMNGISVGSPISRLGQLNKINLIGCKKCEFKCTDRRYLSAHCRIEHRVQNEEGEENFIEKLIIIVKETSEHTEQLMESLLEKAQGLVEELIDFKSAFPKCDTIRGAIDGSDGGMSYTSDVHMGSMSTPPSMSTSSKNTSTHPQSRASTATQNGSFFPDFGLSALSSLTQIAKLSQTNEQTSLLPTSQSIQPSSLAQTLTSQNLASLGSLSLEAFKQFYMNENDSGSDTHTVLKNTQLKKDQSRQRAHPENAPQCHICGRVCSTTWNLKQHIEKHYDIHPQKGVLKKKFEESSRQSNNFIPGFGNTQESIQIENQIQIQHQQLLRQASEISGCPSGLPEDPGNSIVEINASDEPIVQPIPAPLTAPTSEDVVDITASNIKQEKIDDVVSLSPNSTSPVIKKRKPESITPRKYDSSVRDLFSQIGSSPNSSLLTPSSLLNNGPNVIRPSQIPSQLTTVSTLADRGETAGGPNICPYCNKGWRTKSALEMHIRVHTGEEPFICPYCGKGHKQKGQLKVHITKHHPQVQTAYESISLRRDSNPSMVETISKLNPVLARQTDFDCHQCGLSCHSWANLEKHLQWHEEADQNQLTEQSETDRDSPTLSTFSSLKNKNLANLSPSQLKMLKQSFKMNSVLAPSSLDTSLDASIDDKTADESELKSDPDRMEMSDGEGGKMSETEN